MKVAIDKGLAIPFNELLAAVADALRNGCWYPGWIMQLDIRVGHQVAILLEVVRDADHLSMALNHQSIKVWHVETDMEVLLGLESFQ